MGAALGMLRQENTSQEYNDFDLREVLQSIFGYSDEEVRRQDDLWQRWRIAQSHNLGSCSCGLLRRGGLRIHVHEAFIARAFALLFTPLPRRLFGVDVDWDWIQHGAAVVPYHVRIRLYDEVSPRMQEWIRYLLALGIREKEASGPPRENLFAGYNVFLFRSMERSSERVASLLGSFLRIHRDALVGDQNPRIGGKNFPPHETHWMRQAFYSKHISLKQKEGIDARLRELLRGSPLEAAQPHSFKTEEECAWRGYARLIARAQKYARCCSMPFLRSQMTFLFRKTSEDCCSLFSGKDSDGAYGLLCLLQQQNASKALCRRMSQEVVKQLLAESFGFLDPENIPKKVLKRILQYLPENDQYYATLMRRYLVFSSRKKKTPEQLNIQQILREMR